MPAVWVTSFVGPPILTWRLGYRGLIFAPVDIGITLLMLIFEFFLLALVYVPEYKLVEHKHSESKSKRFDRALSLHLTDKPDAEKRLT
jgi:uncharacterized membrane protein